MHATGLADSALLHLSPVTSAVDLLRGQMSWTGLAWQLLWIVGTAVLVGRSARRPRAAAGTAADRAPTGTTDDRAPAGTAADRAPTGAPQARWLPHPGRYAPLAAVRSLARADRRGVVRDGLLVLLLGSVPLLAVVGRVVGTAGVTWAQQRHGLDLGTYLPVVWVVLLVAHTPVILGSLTGLLLLEDRDAGLLPAIATTRASVRTLLTYRLAATAGATAIGLAIGLPLAGAQHAAGGIGVAAVAVGAGALSAVPAMLMAAFATNRVQGVAVMKILGLPLYLPVASFFVVGPLRWAFAPLPSAWPMWTLWAATPAAAVTFAAVGVAVSAAVTALLARRVLRRVTWV